MADDEQDTTLPDETPDPEPTPVKKPAPATVRRVGEWHLVTANDWQISVGPDSVIMLPRHIHPREVADFIAALTVAADVGLEVYTGNIESAKDDDRSLAQRRAFVTQGGPPAGSVRMKTAARQSEQATIGRPSRRGRGAAAAQPAKVQQQPSLTRQEKAARARNALANEAKE